MADTKISALTGATTPLAGTEEAPIVQSATTKKVTVANLTDGRAVTAASLTTTGAVTATGVGGVTINKSAAGGTASLVLANSPSGDGVGRINIVASSTVTNWSINANTVTGGELNITPSTAGGGSTFSTPAWTFLPNSDVKLQVGNLVIGTSGKGITDSTSTTALNFTSTYASFVGGKWLVGTTTASGLGGATPVNISSGTGAAGIGSKASSGTGAIDTSISINQGPSGGTILLLASRNTGAGTATDSAVYVVRFYYDGNNAPTTSYIGGSTDFVTFGVSGSNTLTVTNSAGGNVNYSWFGNK